MGCLERKGQTNDQERVKLRGLRGGPKFPWESSDPECSKSLAWASVWYKLSMVGHSCNSRTPNVVDQEDQEFAVILS